MRRALDQMRPVPFVCAILTALAILIGFDAISIGRVSPGAQESVSRTVSADWVGENSNLVLKALQSSLAGTGVWVPSLRQDAIRPDAQGKVSGDDYLRTVFFDLAQGEVTGRLTVVVDLRTSPATGMKAQVAGAGLSEVTVRGAPPIGRSETIFSTSPVTKARVRYYVNAFCSLAWHLVIAGVLFGIASATGLKEKASMAISLFVASATIAWASKIDPSWVVGTVALAAILVGWTSSEFIRRKRHLEVLKMITG